MKTDKQYLADGVYAAWDGYYVILTTEDGVSVRNEIFIDDQVWAALVDYVERLKQKTAR